MIIETASEVLPENVSQRFLLKKISDRVSEIVNSLFLTNMEEKKIFLLPGFSFTCIHNSQDSRGKGRLSP